jgi:hypothetical protein
MANDSTSPDQQVADRPGQVAPTPLPPALQPSTDAVSPAFNGWDQLVSKQGQEPAGWKNLVSDDGTVAMLTPNGKQAGDVPLHRVQHARESGYHIAIPMTHSSGAPGWVPYHKVADAVSKGFKHANEKLVTAGEELSNLTSAGLLPAFLKTPRGKEINDQFNQEIQGILRDPEKRSNFLVGMVQPGGEGAGELLPELGQRVPRPIVNGKPAVIPPEMTTGKFDAAIKEAGAVPGGIQKGYPELNLPDGIQFHDPATGSSLSLPPEQVTPANVRAKMRESRAGYLKAKPQQSEVVQPGHPLHIPDEKPATVAEGADAFNAENKRPAIDATTKPHDPEFAARVADAFDALKHNPNDPAVQKSYAAMKRDIRAQWDYATQKMGIKFEPWETSFDYNKSFKELGKEKAQPYANSKEMMDDVNNNHHLYFFQGGTMAKDHPLAEIDPQTGYSSNDMLRAVHDLFGHAAHGFQFGPKGEENAYLVHRQMFSPEAIPALTTETRAQNSWFNYGAHLRNAEGKLPAKGEPGFVPTSERPFADNKAALLPPEMQQATPSAAGAESFDPYAGSKPNADNFFMFASPEEQASQREGFQSGKWNVPEQNKPGNPEVPSAGQGHWGATADLLADRPAGGAVDPKTGKEDAKGFGVEVYPEARQRLDHAPTPEDVKSYYETHKDIFDKHPDLRLGWYQDPEKGWELNIGANTQSREGAEWTARKLDQKAIYDIEGGREIPTGGQNEKTSFGRYDIDKRMADASGANFKEMQKNFPSQAETRSMIRAGQVAKNWWQDSREIMSLLGNADPETAHDLGQFLTAVSSNKGNDLALRMALKIHLDWVEAGKPTAPGAISDIAERAQQQLAESEEGMNLFGPVEPGKAQRMLPVDKIMLERYVGGSSFYHPENLRSAKIANMGLTMGGDPWAGVLDRHTGRTMAYGKESQPVAKMYFAMKDWLRQAALSENMTLEEAQASNWVIGRLLSPDTSLTAPQILEKIKSGDTLKAGETYGDIILNNPKIKELARRVISKSGGTPEEVFADIRKITERGKSELLERSKNEAASPTLKSYLRKAVRGRDADKVKFKADPIEPGKNVVPDIAAKPAPTDWVNETKVRTAMADAWKRAKNGLGEGREEAGFAINGSPSAYAVVPHQQTNQDMKMTTTLQPNVAAEIHVHPTKSQPDPSDNDRKIADKHKIPVYTIHQSGVFKYDPATKKTVRLGDLKDFVK